MSLQTKHTQLDSELTLWESSESPIKIHALTIALTKEVHKVKDCRLTFQVTPTQYQLIDKQALFNLSVSDCDDLIYFMYSFDLIKVCFTALLT